MSASSKIQKIVSINVKNTSKVFDLNQLPNISFGQLEGEKDSKLNADTFYPTYSIQQLLKKNFNYVLSPKGVGKSAIFSALVNKYIPDEFFNYKEHSIISINQAFGNDNDYLDPKKFKVDSIRKNYSIYWGLYIVCELISDIIKNHKDKPNYNEFIEKIKNYEVIKDKFRLYNITDLLNQINIGFTFMVSGLPVEVNPNLKVTKKLFAKVNLNETLNVIDNFYKDNGIIALIVIDRIDNFVSKEAHSVQKNYLQGLVDCIEEITVFKNIDPLLFLRTDLFYAFDIKFEYDKIKDRKIELYWEESETLNFIIYRLFSNKYIYDNYFGHFLKYVLQERGLSSPQKNNLITTIKCFFKDIFSIGKKKKLKNKNIPYKVAANFLKLFFPSNIQSQDFCEWLLKYFKDSNGYINPRLLIYFFNQLFEKGYLEYRTNHKFVESNELSIKNGDMLHFDIFSEKIIEETFYYIRKEEIRNIYKLLKSKEHQILFKEIINKSLQSNGKFKYGDFNIKKLLIEKEEFDTLLKYLQLLGYCKEVEKQIYEVPLIFRDKLILTGEIY